jgi:ATP-dependent Clp protease ATP-binding subunit ClpX
MFAVLDDLDETALIKILVDPKNALSKQYKKLFEMESVQLRFTEGALLAVARQAIERKAGARGLRSILEGIMLDVMYDVPSDPDIKEVIVSEDTVTKSEKPLIVYQHAETA